MKVEIHDGCLGRLTLKKLRHYTGWLILSIVGPCLQRRTSCLKSASDQSTKHRGSTLSMQALGKRLNVSFPAPSSSSDCYYFSSCSTAFSNAKSSISRLIATATSKSGTVVAAAAVCRGRVVALVLSTSRVVAIALCSRSSSSGRVVDVVLSSSTIVAAALCSRVVTLARSRVIASTVVVELSPPL